MPLASLLPERYNADMPTPFTHLAVAQRLLRDPEIPAVERQFLTTQRSAFLLGNIAADARVNSGTKRSDTHFYRYDEPMNVHPWRVMMQQHPALQAAQDDAQRAFLAGYVAHLTMDEVWAEHMLRPNFFEAEWGADRKSRFFMLHILLIFMDERDYAQLEDWQAQALAAAQPADWLPFMTPEDLAGWRDFIQEQVAGESQTLAVLGARVQRTPEDFRAVLDSPEQMADDLWRYVPQTVLGHIEQQMYIGARDQMQVYLDEAAAAIHSR